MQEKNTKTKKEIGQISDEQLVSKAKADDKQAMETLLLSARNSQLMVCSVPGVTVTLRSTRGRFLPTRWEQLTITAVSLLAEHLISTLYHCPAVSPLYRA